MEEFKTISDFPNYQIWNYGNVYNIKFKKLNPIKLNVGYYIVNLYKNKKMKTIYIHKLVATHFIHNLSNKKYVDHIDQNKLNNHFSNLRWVSNWQNKMNWKKYKNSSSNYKGVCKWYSKWIWYIYINYEKHHLGTFKDEIEAAKIYNEKAKELFGEFAWLNIIE